MQTPSHFSKQSFGFQEINRFAKPRFGFGSLKPGFETKFRIST